VAAQATDIRSGQVYATDRFEVVLMPTGGFHNAYDKH
jgi:hypothetical protein